MPAAGARARHNATSGVETETGHEAVGSAGASAHPGPVLHDAAVHDHDEAGVPGTGRGRLVHHAFLQPEGRQAERDALVHHVGHVLGAAEHVDEVDLLPGRQAGDRLPKAGSPSDSRIAGFTGRMR